MEYRQSELKKAAIFPKGEIPRFDQWKSTIDLTSPTNYIGTGGMAGYTGVYFGVSNSYPLPRLSGAE